MAALFPPYDGIDGVITFSSYEMPATAWSWQSNLESMMMPGLSALPYQNTLRGHKSVVLNASGFVRFGYNPFLLGTPLKLGKYVSARLAINILRGQSATCPSALVTKWDYACDCNGAVSFQIQLVGSWKYTDFGGTDA